MNAPALPEMRSTVEHPHGKAPASSHQALFRVGGQDWSRVLTPRVRRLA